MTCSGGAQPFQVLAMLLECPGEVMARGELQKRLWPADTFVDFDHSLNTAIKKLRQALSDDKKNPRFIETLPKRGYRFVATVNLEVEEETETSSPPKAPTVTKEAPPAGPMRWLPAKQAIGMLLVLILAVVEGFTCKQIAGMLAIPTGTVMSRLSRARASLRNALERSEQSAGLAVHNVC